MFIALDESKNRVSIENALKGKTYFCPSCGEPLIVKAKESVAVKAHFAHKKGTDCDDFTHDMSEWHLSWQKLFPEECREVPLELNGEKHRADVLINNTVIEFQHSPIRAEEIARRNAFYLSCGYDMVWVFDANDQIKNEYEETLDPAKSLNHGFVWKRAKQQFSVAMDSRVRVFIEYKTDVSAPSFNGQKIDNLLLLTRIDSKDIDFLHTIVGFKNGDTINEKYFYLLRDNFVKQYNDKCESNVVPAGSIIDESIKYLKYKQEYQRRAAQRRVIYVPVGRSSRRRGL